MVTLDKVKLVATLDCLDDFNPAKFTAIKKGDMIKTMKFKMTEPFALSIEIRQDVKELVIEFTGKILGREEAEFRLRHRRADRRRKRARSQI